jgi:Domain of unknown function (DUF5615)
LDEDVHAAVAAGLRRRGFEVVTTIDAGRSGTTDEDQLEFAAAQGRVLITFNRGDFARLHAEYLGSRRPHAGIVVSRQAAAGPVIRALAKLLGSRDASELGSTLLWLAISDR